jgi:hypothetical protein
MSRIILKKYFNLFFHIHFLMPVTFDICCSLLHQLHFFQKKTNNNWTTSATSATKDKSNPSLLLWNETRLSISRFERLRTCISISSFSDRDRFAGRVSYICLHLMESCTTCIGWWSHTPIPPGSRITDYRRMAAAIPAAYTPVNDDLYNRVLYAFGLDGYKVLQQCHRTSVLIIGLRGLGLEVAKHMVLNGMHIGVCDNGLVHIADLGSQVQTIEFNFDWKFASSDSFWVSRPGFTTHSHWLFTRMSLAVLFDGTRRWHHACTSLCWSFGQPQSRNHSNVGRRPYRCSPSVQPALSGIMAVDLHGGLFGHIFKFFIIIYIRLSWWLRA